MAEDYGGRLAEALLAYPLFELMVWRGSLWYGNSQYRGTRNRLIEHEERRVICRPETRWV